MKKSILFVCTLFIAGSLLASAPTGNVNEKVLKVFNETFGTSATEVTWTELNNTYTVKFVNHGFATTVKYDEDGNFISSICYYTGNELPIDIQCKLKKKYADKKIFGVTEQVVGDEVTYFVKLEDDKSWITVKIDNYRNMQITEKYKKA